MFVTFSMGRLPWPCCEKCILVSFENGELVWRIFRSIEFVCFLVVFVGTYHLYLVESTCLFVCLVVIFVSLPCFAKSISGPICLELLEKFGLALSQI